MIVNPVMLQINAKCTQKYICGSNVSLQNVNLLHASLLHASLSNASLYMLVYHTLL